MPSILFPTDFTELSLNAFTYAMEYAQKSNAKLVVFHTYSDEANVPEAAQKVYDKIDIQNFRNKKDKFPKFEKLIKESKAGELKVKYVVMQGDFVTSLKEYVALKEDKIEVIIMGTSARNQNLFDIFIESDTNKVLEEINKPVIAVPENSVFDGTIDNIAFLVDYKEDEKEPLQVVIQKSRDFGSDLHVIHFDLAHAGSIAPLMDNFKKSLNEIDLGHIQFVSIDTMNLKESLIKYCNEHQIDMVCLINHKRNFYQRLFSLSLAEDLLNTIDVPVMAIYAE